MFVKNAEMLTTITKENSNHAFEMLFLVCRCWGLFQFPTTIHKSMNAGIFALEGFTRRFPLCHCRRMSLDLTPRPKMFVEVFGRTVEVDRFSLAELMKREDHVRTFAMMENPDATFEQEKRTQWVRDKTKEGGWKILRTDYLLNRDNHIFGRGNLLVMDPQRRLRAVEFMSSRGTGPDTSERRQKLQDRSMYYASVAEKMLGRHCMATGVIEHEDGKLEEKEFEREETEEIEAAPVVLEDELENENIEAFQDDGFWYLRKTFKEKEPEEAELDALRAIGKKFVQEKDVEKRDFVLSYVWDGVEYELDLKKPRRLPGDSEPPPKKKMSKRKRSREVTTAQFQLDQTYTTVKERQDLFVFTRKLRGKLKKSKEKKFRKVVRRYITEKGIDPSRITLRAISRDGKEHRVPWKDDGD